MATKTARYDTLVRRAITRTAMGRGGAATEQRVATADRPTATINDPTAPHVRDSFAQPTTHQPKPKATNPRVPKTSKAPPAIDPTTQALIDAAIHLKFGGAEQGVNQQLQANARFGNGLGGWYQQAIDEIKGQQQPIPQTAMPTPTGDPAADSRAAAAYAYQQQRNNALGAGNTFLTNVGAGLNVAGANAANAANASRQNLLSQQTQLKGQEGDFATTFLNDLQASQQKAAFQQAQLATQQLRDQAAIDIQQGNLQLAQERLKQADRIYQTVTLPNAQTQQSKSATDQAKTQTEIDFFNSHGYWPPTGPPTKGKGSGSAGDSFSRSQGETSAHHKVIRDVNNTLSDVKRLQSQGFSDAAVTGALEKNHVPADILSAAMTLAGGGRLNATQIKQLKLAGLIAAPHDWKPVKLKTIAPKDRPR